MEIASLTILVVLEGAAQCAHRCKPERFVVFVTALNILEHLNGILDDVARIPSDDRLTKH